MPGSSLKSLWGTQAHTHTFTHTHTHTNACEYKQARTHSYTCTHVRTHTKGCKYKQVCTHSYTRIHTHSHTHAHGNTYKHPCPRTRCTDCALAGQIQHTGASPEPKTPVSPCLPFSLWYFGPWSSLLVPILSAMPKKIYCTNVAPFIQVKSAFLPASSLPPPFNCLHSFINSFVLDEATNSDILVAHLK